MHKNMTTEACQNSVYKSKRVTVNIFLRTNFSITHKDAQPFNIIFSINLQLVHLLPSVL